MQSDQIKDLATALAKAQGDMTGIPKDETNPHYKSKYESLASTLEAIRAPLAANGLSYIQLITSRDGERVVVTRLMHNSGQFIEDDGLPLLMDKQNMQGLKSAITYARRIGLQLMVGVAPSEDDDGNLAVETPGQNQKPLPAPPGRPEGQEKPKRDPGEANLPKREPAPQYQIMRAGDGSIQTFPRTGRGAMSAIKLLEDLCLDDADNWQVNRTMAVDMANSAAGKLRNDQDERSIKERLAELMELVEGTQTILDAG